MDEFERKLSVALKTVCRELPEHHAVASAPIARRRPSRLLLAAAVVVLLVATVAGSWWALADRSPVNRSQPASTSPCTADTLRPTMFRGGDDGFDPSTRSATAIGYTATVACTLDQPPSMSSDGQQYAWDPTPGDATDPSVWEPVDLAEGAVITFAAVQVHLAGADCVVGTHPQQITFTVLGRDNSVGTDVSSCGPLVLTTESVAPPSTRPAPHGPEAPCTSADLFVAPTDIGLGTLGVGLAVTALNACTLQHAPVTSVDLEPVPYAASVDDPGDTTPWMPTALRAGELARFALVFPDTSGVTCSPANGADLTVRAQVDGGARTVFRWSASPCGASLLRLTPRTTPSDLPACAAADADLHPSTTAGKATLTFTAHPGVRCRLVDPPTVMASDELVPWRSSTDLQAAGRWPAPVLEPGRDLALTVSRVCPTADCPAEDGPVSLSVGVGGAWLDGVRWDYAGNAGVLVLTLP